MVSPVSWDCEGEARTERAMPCIIPHCRTATPTGHRRFPGSTYLCQRWIQAIQLGSGETMPNPATLAGKMICEWHFEDVTEQIPSRFWNERQYDNKLVASCSFCLLVSLTEYLQPLDEDMVVGGRIPIATLLSASCHIKWRTVPIEIRYICERCLAGVDVMYAICLQFRNNCEQRDTLEELSAQYMRGKGSRAKHKVELKSETESDMETENVETLPSVTHFETKSIEIRRLDTPPMIEEVVVNGGSEYVEECNKDTLIDEEENAPVLQEPTVASTNSRPSRRIRLSEKGQQCKKVVKLAMARNEGISTLSGDPIDENLNGLESEANANEKEPEATEDGHASLETTNRVLVVYKGQKPFVNKTRKGKSFKKCIKVNPVEEDVAVPELVNALEDENVEQVQQQCSQEEEHTIMSDTEDTVKIPDEQLSDSKQPEDQPIKENGYSWKSFKKDRKCYICRKVLASAIELMDHLLVHENEELRCQLCHEGFHNVLHLNRHLIKHDAIVRPFKCRFCELRYTSLKLQQEHERSRHGHGFKRYAKKRKFVCQHCGRQCASANTLRDHEDRHYGIKRYECDVCHRKFSNRSIRERHKLLHTSIMLYKCHICNRKFRQSTLYNDHLRYHTNDYRYTCQECGQSFTSSSNLRRHQIRKHNRPHREVDLLSFVATGDDDEKRKAEEDDDEGLEIEVVDGEDENEEEENEDNE